MTVSRGKRARAGEPSATTTDRVERLTAHHAIVYGAGEPYGPRAGRCLDKRRRPRSLWTAMLRTPAEQSARIALEWLGLTRERDRASVMWDCVMWDACQTDRVTVRRDARGAIVCWLVWLDPKGAIRFQVWP